jgi:hypothetical protein
MYALSSMRSSSPPQEQQPPTRASLSAPTINHDVNDTVTIGRDTTDHEGPTMNTRNEPLAPNSSFLSSAPLPPLNSLFVTVRMVSQQLATFGRCGTPFGCHVIARNGQLLCTPTTGTSSSTGKEDDTAAVSVSRNSRNLVSTRKRRDHR